MQGSGA